MAAPTLAEEYLSRHPDNARLYQQERAIYEVTELIEEALSKSGKSRSELAKLSGRSRGWVTQLLDVDANKTIRTVADVFAVLGSELKFSFEPITIEKHGAQILRVVDGGGTWSYILREPSEQRRWRTPIQLPEPEIRVG